MIITAIALLLTGLLFTIGNNWLSNTFYKPRYHRGYEDFEDIIRIIGFMILFFGIACFIYGMVHFNPRYFKITGLVIGLIVSIIHARKCLQVFEESGNDKYSGGGSGMILVGCLGFFIFPFAGYITGFFLKSVLV